MAVVLALLQQHALDQKTQSARVQRIGAGQRHELVGGQRLGGVFVGHFLL